MPELTISLTDGGSSINADAPTTEDDIRRLVVYSITGDPYVGEALVQLIVAAIPRLTEEQLDRFRHVQQEMQQERDNSRQAALAEFEEAQARRQQMRGNADAEPHDA